MGNNNSTNMLGIGTCKLVMGRTLYFHDVLYAPEVRQNIFCVVLLQLGFKIVFEKDCVNVLLDNVCYGSGFMLDGFIVLDFIQINTNTSTFFIGSSSNDSLFHDVKWHARLGHIGQGRLKRLAKADLLGSIEKIDLPICENYLVGKATRLPFGKAKRATLPLQLIDSDICRPNECKSTTWCSLFLHFYR